MRRPRPTTKICSHPRCSHKGTPQPLSQFRRSPLYTKGYVSNCIDCEIDCSRRRSRDPVYRSKAYAERKNRLRKPAGRKLTLLDSARHRARAAGLPCTITVDDFSVPEFCPVRGVRLQHAKRGKSLRDSPSLDRIDPRLGYVPGNVWVISHLANSVKQSLSAEELLQLAKNLVKALRRRNRV